MAALDELYEIVVEHMRIYVHRVIGDYELDKLWLDESDEHVRKLPDCSDTTIGCLNCDCKEGKECMKLRPDVVAQYTSRKYKKSFYVVLERKEAMRVSIDRGLRQITAFNDLCA